MGRVQETKEGGKAMPLSRDFRETVMEELRDPAYRRAFLREAINALLRDDLETAKPSLRAYINGTMGFTRAGEDMGRSPKSLMRMLGPDGNPQAKNLLHLIAYLQKAEGATWQMVETMAA
jgi:DNA-binding phage protein